MPRVLLARGLWVLPVTAQMREEGSGRSGLVLEVWPWLLVNDVSSRVAWLPQGMAEGWSWGKVCSAPAVSSC